MILIFVKHNFTICNKYGVFKKVPELNCPKLYDKRGNSTRNTGFIIVFEPILSISIYSLCSKCLNLNQLELSDAVHLFCAGYLYNLALTCHKNVLKIMCTS